LNLPDPACGRLGIAIGDGEQHQRFAFFLLRQLAGNFDFTGKMDGAKLGVFKFVLSFFAFAREHFDAQKNEIAAVGRLDPVLRGNADEALDEIDKRNFLPEVVDFTVRIKTDDFGQPSRALTLIGRGGSAVGGAQITTAVCGRRRRVGRYFKETAVRA